MHRFLAIGLAASFALAWSGEAAAWSWPAGGEVLRAFELGADPYAAGQHRGIDVAGADGSAVVAPASGVVTFAGSLPTYGRGVTILTDDGYAVTLVHLGAIDVAKGDAVNEGTAVGTMGSTGTAEHAVPSVHLGIRRADDEEAYVDPLSLLPPRPAPAPAPAPSPAPAPVAAPVPAAPAATVQQQPASPAPSVPAPAAGAGTATPVTPSVAHASTAARPATADASPTTEGSPADAPAAPASAPEPGIAIHSAAGTTAAPSAATTAGRAETPAEGAAPIGHGLSVVRSGAVASASRPLAPSSGARNSPTVDVAAGARESSEALGRDRGTASASGGQPVEAPSAADVGATKHAAAHGGGDRDASTVRSVPAHRQRLSTHARGGEGPRPTDATAPSTQVSAAAAPDDAQRRQDSGRRAVAPAHGRHIGLRMLLAGLALAALLAVAVAPRAARRIGLDGAVLRHHPDLLRQLDPAHRARVHDRGRGHVRAPSAAART